MSAPDSALAHHRAPVDDPTGPPIVFLHGFASTAASDWPEHAWSVPYARAGRETLLIELPGHGDAAPVASVEQAVTHRVLRDIANTVRFAVTGPVDVVGYSLGARLAWDLVGSGALSTRRLVLGGLSPADPFEAVDIDAARALCHGGSAAGDPLTAAIASLARAASAAPEALIDLVAGLAREPFRPRSNPPEVPTLLVAGEADVMATGAEQLVGALLDGQLVHVPGDHRAALLGAEFRDVVSQFLDVT